MKILSCMYGGEYGYNALRIASKIAKATSSELTLMYVVEKVPDRFAAMFKETAAGPGKTIADLYQNIPDLEDTIFKNAGLEQNTEFARQRGFGTLAINSTFDTNDEKTTVRATGSNARGG